MFAHEIQSVCSKHYLLDLATERICTADQLPDSPDFYPAYYFVNTLTNKDAYMPGHWILVMHSSPYEIEYFDPLALPKWQYPLCLREKITNYSHNDLIVQNVQSTACASFCLYVAFKKLQGRSLLSIQKDLLDVHSSTDDRAIRTLCKKEKLTIL